MPPIARIVTPFEPMRFAIERMPDMSLTPLFVAPSDLGKLIGRQGRTAAALRTLAATAGEKEGKDVTLEIRESR